MKKKKVIGFIVLPLILPMFLYLSRYSVEKTKLCDVTINVECFINETDKCKIFVEKVRDTFEQIEGKNVRINLQTSEYPIFVKRDPTTGVVTITYAKAIIDNYVFFEWNITKLKEIGEKLCK